ncbi:unnamed protein product [Prunus armeniaca]
MQHHRPPDRSGLNRCHPSSLFPTSATAEIRRKKLGFAPVLTEFRRLRSPSSGSHFWRSRYGNPSTPRALADG